MFLFDPNVVLFVERKDVVRSTSCLILQPTRHGGRGVPWCVFSWLAPPVVDAMGGSVLCGLWVLVASDFGRGMTRRTPPPHMIALSRQATC